MNLRDLIKLSGTWHDICKICVEN